jgi:glycosyltransferase involved in cell wall biosynthesis
VALIWTRKLDDEQMVGRLRVAQAIRAAVSSRANVATFRVPSMVAERTARRVMGAMSSLGLSWLRGQPLPIQCAIFACSSDLRAIRRAIPRDAQVIYLDGVRCYELLRVLRREWPDRKIVVDFDDLMSRRMDLLLASGQPLSPGYLSERLPAVVRRLVMSRLVGRAIVLYESKTLKAVEARTLALADAVVLLSADDAAALEKVRAAANGSRAEIVTVPPAVALADAQPIVPPLRFVFVGTDTLTQNRLTIDYLLRLWRRERIATPLCVFGRQTRRMALPPHVTMPGYVASLKEIHDGHSVLLTPSFLRGGIKTKVLEAFSFGTAVIGNSQTFESMPIGDYPLRIDEEADLLKIVRDPESRRELFQGAADHGRAYLRAYHAPDAFADRWRRLMGLQGLAQ